MRLDYLQHKSGRRGGIECVAAALEHRGIAAEQFRTLKPGQVWEL